MKSTYPRWSFNTIPDSVERLSDLLISQHHARSIALCEAKSLSAVGPVLRSKSRTATIGLRRALCVAISCRAAPPLCLRSCQGSNIDQLGRMIKVTPEICEIAEKYAEIHMMRTRFRGRSSYENRKNMRFECRREVEYRVYGGAHWTLRYSRSANETAQHHPGRCL
jgi:hypothetical protein